VVGADGLRIDSESKKPMADDRGKLIRLRGPNVDLVCGWAGAGRVTCNGQDFDLWHQTERIGSDLSGEHLGERYIEQFSEELHRSIPRDVKDLFAKWGTRTLFVGYVDNQEQHWVWQLQDGSKPKRGDCIDEKHSYYVLSGHLFCEYRLQSSPQTLEEGARALSLYLRCCEGSDQGKYGGCTQTLSVPLPWQ
jgi:hypothetical protein